MDKLVGDRFLQRRREALSSSERRKGDSSPFLYTYTAAEPPDRENTR